MTAGAVDVSGDTRLKGLFGGAPMVSLDGITGLTVPPNDPEALATAIQQIIDDPELRERFGKAAHKRAREEFSMDKMLSSLFKEYKKLMNAG